LQLSLWNGNEREMRTECKWTKQTNHQGPRVTGTLGLSDPDVKWREVPESFHQRSAGIFHIVSEICMRKAKKKNQKSGGRKNDKSEQSMRHVLYLSWG
jgi:hypothetical protein